MQWFRFYREVLDDPKVQRLPAHLFRTWVNLLCLGSENNGKLPSVDDIAFKLRMSAQDAAQQLDELILAGLVDIEPNNSIVMHNWGVRQYASDDSKERVRRHRAKKSGNDDVTVTETPPEQNRTDSETETETPLPPNDAESPELGCSTSFDLGGVRLGGRSREVSVETKRRVAQMLNIADATPLVALYEGWKGSKRANDVDAHFIATAPKLLAKAAPPVKAACGSLAEPVPEIAAKPVRASSQLVASLTRKR
jgi:hypothetical protein